MPRKTKPKVKVYNIISDAIDSGITFGLNHAHKHVDNPTREDLEHHLHNDIMCALGEVLDFDLD